jgi:hypothetical protein
MGISFLNGASITQSLGFLSGSDLKYWRKADTTSLMAVCHVDDPSLRAQLGRPVQASLLANQIRHFRGLHVNETLGSGGTFTLTQKLRVECAAVYETKVSLKYCDD